MSEVSPLQDIERRVQLRAKEISLDMAGEGGKPKLRSLIAEEVAAWSDGYKRGLRAFDLADPEIVAERAYRNLAGYGPLSRSWKTTTSGRSWSTAPTRSS